MINESEQYLAPNFDERHLNNFNKHIMPSHKDSLLIRSGQSVKQEDPFNSADHLGLLASGATTASGTNFR